MLLILAFSIPAFPQAKKSAPSTPKKHRDHNPKHGGTFFMALNQQHHLEGVLERPGTFRVYLYDVISKPLAPAQAKLASGTVEWGEAENAPETPLTLSKDGSTLEASWDKAKPPIAVTLRVRFPGAPAKSRPELFTFDFQDYSVPPPASAGHEGQTMDHSTMDHSSMGHGSSGTPAGKQPPAPAPQKTH